MTGELNDMLGSASTFWPSSKSYSDQKAKCGREYALPIIPATKPQASAAIGKTAKRQSYVKTVSG
jgi:hypothetical protein